MAHWFLNQCVRERGVAPGGVVATAWFVVPVSDLQARSVADMPLFFAARDFALAKGWIARGPRPGTYILTAAGYEAAIAEVQAVQLASAPEADQQDTHTTPEEPSTKPEDDNLRRNSSGAVGDLVLGLAQFEASLNRAVTAINEKLGMPGHFKSLPKTLGQRQRWMGAAAKQFVALSPVRHDIRRVVTLGVTLAAKRDSVLSVNDDETMHLLTRGPDSEHEAASLQNLGSTARALGLNMAKLSQRIEWPCPRPSK